MCGEHYKHRGSITPNPGSSPRVRGTLELDVELRRVCGIIPACAGNTSMPFAQPPRPRDHPRVCGEHKRLPIAEATVGGSSPRVRGTPEPVSLPVLSTGIIPACAGNTSPHSWTIRPSGDHPRVCGEHVTVTLMLAFAWGSSPRVRGTPHGRGQ